MSTQCSAFRRTEQLKVHKWLTEISYAACKGMATLSKESVLEEAIVPQWTKTVNGKIWNQLMEDVEARNARTPTGTWWTQRDEELSLSLMS